MSPARDQCCVNYNHSDTMYGKPMVSRVISPARCHLVKSGSNQPKEVATAIKRIRHFPMDTPGRKSSKPNRCRGYDC